MCSVTTFATEICNLSTLRPVAKGAVVLCTFRVAYVCGHSRFLLEITDVAVDQSEHNTFMHRLGRSLQDVVIFYTHLVSTTWLL
jgi:hypothetical protein